MDNSSFPNSTDDTVSDLPVVHLHVAAQAVLVVLLAVGLVGSLVGNTLLLVLMILGRKTLNSTGVYLIFLAVVNLIYSFIAFEGMIAIGARYWVFGSTMCKLTSYLIYPVYFSVVFIHPFLAADLVLYTFRPFQYKRRKLPAFLCSLLALSYPLLTQITLSAGNFTQAHEFWLLPDGRRFTLCQLWQKRLGSSTARVLVPLLAVPPVIVSYAIIVTCCVLYAVALVKLHHVQKARKQAREQFGNGMLNGGVFALDWYQEASFYGSREAETIKSLAGVFILQVTSTLFPLTVSLFTVPIPPLWAYLATSVIPLLSGQISLLLVLTNKLYRGRISDILICSCKVEQQWKMEALRASRLSCLFSHRPQGGYLSRSPLHKLSISESEEAVHTHHSFCNTVAPERLDTRNVCRVGEGQCLSRMSLGGSERQSLVPGGEGTQWAVSQGSEERSSVVSQRGAGAHLAVALGEEGRPLSMSPTTQRRNRIQWALKQISPGEDGDQGLLTLNI